MSYFKPRTNGWCFSLSISTSSLNKPSNVITTHLNLRLNFLSWMFSLSSCQMQTHWGKSTSTKAAERSGMVNRDSVCVCVAVCLRPNIYMCLFLCVSQCVFVLMPAGLGSRWRLGANIADAEVENGAVELHLWGNCCCWWWWWRRPRLGPRLQCWCNGTSLFLDITLSICLWLWLTVCRSHSSASCPSGCAYLSLHIVCDCILESLTPFTATVPNLVVFSSGQPDMSVLSSLKVIHLSLPLSSVCLLETCAPPFANKSRAKKLSNPTVQRRSFM